MLLIMIVFVGILVRVAWILIQKRIESRPQISKPRSRKYKLLAVLGSGGHTTEMLTLLNPLIASARFSTSMIVAENDATSVARIPSILKTDAPYSIRTIPRIRNVGESLLVALFRVPLAFFSALVLLLKSKPDLIIANGPGTCIPIIFAAFILEVLGVHSSRTMFVESFCRVKTLSITGRIVYAFTDRFILQWPPTAEIRRQYPRAKYLGVLL